MMNRKTNYVIAIFFNLQTFRYFYTNICPDFEFLTSRRHFRLLAKVS